MKQEQVAEKKNGDGDMKNAIANCPGLDLNLILGKGTVISSHEALEDATPISWSKEVLDGSKKAIIKSKEYDGDEHV